MENVKICHECGKVLEAGEGYEIAGGGYICDECYYDEYTVCDECGEIVHNDYTMWINDRTVCDDCRDDLYTVCQCCNDYVRNSHAHDTADGYVCEYCYYEHYVECNSCGEMIHIDNAHYDDWNEAYYCRDCHNDQNIKPYGYKPEPVFYGTDSPLFMGIELEIDGGGENHDNAGELLAIDDLDRIYCKHDGSLDEGFEIVSHPATLEYHRNSMQWSKIMEHALYMGYTSHNAGTCGLHIHISRNALGEEYDQQEQNIAKILYFVEKHWNKMLRFSRRTEYQLDRWASRYGIEPHEQPEDILKKAKNGCGRYKAINLLNWHTVEFRLFRGTLKYSTFMATLQLVSDLCKYCTSLTAEELQQASWRDFVATITDDTLITYLENRGILEV